MKNTIICDLDGTLADCTHRRHYVETKPKNWDAFYAGVKDDQVNLPVAHLLETYLTHRDVLINRTRLIFCTGRPRRCGADTVKWLMKVGIHTYHALYMRADGDFRADYIVKQEMLDKHIDKDRVLFVLDDRQQVVDMWRRNGLTCFQVAPGNF